MLLEMNIYYGILDKKEFASKYLEFSLKDHKYIFLHQVKTGAIKLKPNDRFF